LSQRGWGQFSVDELDIAAGRGSISLRNSIFVLEWSLSAREHVCYIFEGSLMARSGSCWETTPSRRASHARRPIAPPDIGTIIAVLISP
jgi:hypothetical protein